MSTHTSPARPDGGPSAADRERCDQYDNDLDGLVDEGCSCAPEETQPCYPGPLGADVGACTRGTQRCLPAPATQEFSSWGVCEGATLPRAEACTNGLDDDCDGHVDEDCGGDAADAATPDGDAGGGTGDAGGGTGDAGGGTGDGGEDPCALVAAGRYAGTFSGTITLSTGRVLLVDGAVALRLEQRDAPGLLDVVEGTMRGLAERRYPFAGTIEGSLDCATRKFDAHMVGGHVDVGDMGAYDFEGSLEADYLPGVGALAAGVWGAEQTGGGPATGGVGTGSWSCGYVGP